METSHSTEEMSVGAARAKLLSCYGECCKWLCCWYHMRGVQVAGEVGMWNFTGIEATKEDKKKKSRGWQAGKCVAMGEGGHCCCFCMAAVCTRWGSRTQGLFMLQCVMKAHQQTLRPVLSWLSISALSSF